MTIAPLEVQCPEVVEAGIMPITQPSQSPVDVSGLLAPVDLAALLDEETTGGSGELIPRWLGQESREHGYETRGASVSVKRLGS